MISDKSGLRGLRAVASTSDSSPLCVMRFADTAFSDRRVGAGGISRVFPGSQGKESFGLFAHGVDDGLLG